MTLLSHYAIHQLFPAHGFRVIECRVFDDGHPATFNDVPVIGWAILRCLNNPDKPKSRKLDAELSKDGIELYVWSDDRVISLRDLKHFPGANYRYHVLPPQAELSEECKTKLEEDTRKDIERRRKHDDNDSDSGKR